MIRPLTFDYALFDDEEESLPVHLVVEAESADHIFIFDKKSGQIQRFEDLPAEDKNLIKQRVEDYWFMNDAVSGWNHS